MALSAEQRSVLWLVLSEVAALVTVGLVIGAVAALTTSQFVEKMLFGAKPTDPFTLTAAVLILIGVAALAGYLPARRAAGLDLMVALREE